MEPSESGPVKVPLFLQKRLGVHTDFVHCPLGIRGSCMRQLKDAHLIFLTFLLEMEDTREQQEETVLGKQVALSQGGSPQPSLGVMSHSRRGGDCRETQQECTPHPFYHEIC